MTKEKEEKRKSKIKQEQEKILDKEKEVILEEGIEQRIEEETRRNKMTSICGGMFKINTVWRVITAITGP